MSIKLNLGAGKDIREGYINCDIIKLDGINTVFDLNKYPYPFERNSVDEILAIQVIEHLDEPIKFLEECFAILNFGGRMFIKVPHFSSANAYKLDHKWQCSWDAFKVLYDFKKYDYICKKRFQLIKNKLCFGKKYAIWNHILEPLFNLIPLIYEGTILKSIFPCEELYIELRKKQ